MAVPLNSGLTLLSPPSFSWPDSSFWEILSSTCATRCCQSVKEGKICSWYPGFLNRWTQRKIYVNTSLRSIRTLPFSWYSQLTTSQDWSSWLLYICVPSKPEYFLKPVNTQSKTPCIQGTVQCSCSVTFRVDMIWLGSLAAWCRWYGGFLWHYW